MRTFRTCLFTVLALAIAAATSPSARATWLDLADGTYNVTLSCTFSLVLSCPTDIHGTMTISGAGATAFDFTVNGQLFLGDPVDELATDGVTFDNQHSRLDLSPLSSLTIGNDLTIQNPFIPFDHWWAYCRNNPGTDACFPDTVGSWTASPAPAPAAIRHWVPWRVSFAH